MHRPPWKLLLLLTLAGNLVIATVALVLAPAPAAAPTRDGALARPARTATPQDSKARY